jgi:hypothetical protein
MKEYKQPGGAPCFLELWDVGGSARYSETRKVFYADYHGLKRFIIL